MKLIFIILVLVILVTAMAFWKDIRTISARQSKRKKSVPMPAEELVKKN
jgi:hypothetical protein